ncbi:ABC transporter permease [Romboutsia sp.]|uniref:ABC transporter permease n=1 Tax=Romboutsia sp. TaxID=1965302 RepID=UPI002CEBE3A8|nr:ABC transporter permease [Romboutsia sp.]HSQ87465.1 ABC transporter permease [Romboutsia sp.]
MKNETLKILLKRIVSSLVVLFLLITVIFILLRVSPGDPSDKFISPELSPQLIAHVRDSFNLNSSILVQYEAFIVNLCKGDFGISYSYRMPVLSVIIDYLRFTLIFSLVSFAIQIGLGFLLAIISFQKVNGFIDKMFSKLSLVVYAIPSFVIGVFLIYIFSATLNILPSSGLRSFDSADYSFFQSFFDYARHMILPLATLSLGGIAVFYKYLRDNLEDTYNKPFIMNLRANGLDDRTILLKHIIPNAMGPLIAVAGVELGLLFGGALITEVIFGLPGMGRLTINAIFSRDYPLVIGCTFVSGVLVILSNFIADLLKAKIDKRLIKGILN